MQNIPYQKRKYRDQVKVTDLASFHVVDFETDLLICAEDNLYNEALKSIKYYRKQLTDYIKLNAKFEKSFSPVLTDKDAPPIIKEMLQAGIRANVGPFAAVAGAVAEYVGKDLLKLSRQVIIENGGDIFLASSTDRILGIYAGSSPLTGKVGIKIKATQTPIGVCTSSGTVGHSTSFGKADSVTIISKSTALADAVATATANLIQTKDDIDKAIEFGQSVEEITGIVAIIGKHMGAWGNIEIVKT